MMLICNAAGHLCSATRRLRTGPDAYSNVRVCEHCARRGHWMLRGQTQAEAGHNRDLQEGN